MSMRNTQDKWTPRVLAAAIVLGFFGVLAGLMFGQLSEGAKDPTLLMLGALSAAFGAVVQYHFGSTSGSAVKSELLANVQASQAAPDPLGNKAQVTNQPPRS